MDGDSIPARVSSRRFSYPNAEREAAKNTEVAMLFDLLRRWPIRLGWYFDKDEPGGGGTDDSAEGKADKKEESAEPKAGDDKDKGKAKKEEKTFTQAELDAIIDDRLKRERKKADDATEKARKAAEEEALKKNQEWQTLAEKRATEIDTLTKEKTELEPFKEQAEKYKTALTAILEKQKKALPKFVLPLIEKMDPVDAMTYITDHAEELGATPLTYSETPEGKEKKVSDDDKKSAQQASTSVITRSF